MFDLRPLLIFLWHTSGQYVEFGDASTSKVEIELQHVNNQTFFFVEFYAGKSCTLVRAHLDLFTSKSVFPSYLFNYGVHAEKFKQAISEEAEAKDTVVVFNKQIKATPEKIFYSRKKFEFDSYEFRLIKSPKNVMIDLSKEQVTEGHPVIDFGRFSGFRNMFFTDEPFKRKTLCFYFHLRSQSRSLEDFHEEDFVLSSMIKIYNQCEPRLLSTKNRYFRGKFIDHSLSNNHLSFLGSISVNGNAAILPKLRFCVDNSIDHFFKIKNAHNFLTFLQSVICRKTEHCFKRRDLFSYRWSMYLTILGTQGDVIQKLAFDEQDLIYFDDDDFIRYNIDEFTQSNDPCDVYVGNLFLFRFNLLIRSTANKENFYQQTTQFIFVENRSFILSMKDLMMIGIVTVAFLTLISLWVGKPSTKKDEKFIEFLNK